MATSSLSSVAASLASTFVETRMASASAASPPTLSPPEILVTSFAADLDFAEKGTSFVSIIPNKTKRTIAAKNNSDKTDTPTKNTDHENKEVVEGSRTGTEKHQEVDIAIEGLAQLEDQDLTSSPSIPTTSSAESSKDSNIGDNERKEQAGTTADNASKIDNGHGRIIARNYESYPDGWPRFAAFQNSSSSVRMFRRFGQEHCRVLLHLQAEITAIKQKLDELDVADSLDADMEYRLRRNEWREGWDCAQKDLLEDLRAKLLQYDDVLLKDSGLRALASPPARDYFTYFNWIWRKRPLDIGQWDFALHRDDFVSTSNASARNGFEGLIERCLSYWPQLSQRFIKHKKQVHGTEDEEVYVFPVAKIALMARLLAVSVAVTLLLIPVFLLFLITMSSAATLVMVLTFVLAFASVMSLSGVKVEGVFIGTCTYCAVLVTFLGNVHGGSSGRGN